jgi:hypothetical protein
MRPPPPLLGLPQKAAIGAAQTMEENMRLLTSDELLRCSKGELCDLFRQTETSLCELAQGSLDHEIGRLNLHKIRRALARLEIVL